MIELLNIDCMEYMKGVSDKAFELAIVDPPYGIGNWVQQTGNIRGEKVNWNDSIPNKDYFIELERVSKERIIWGANYYNCFNDKGGAIIWNKKNPNPKFSTAEIASYSGLKRVAIIEIPYHGWFIIKEDRFHPCGKPVALYKKLLTDYAKKGDRILDTHLGSGSIAIACHDMGFNLVGCEIDVDYYKAACKRFKEQTMQLKLAV